MTEVSSDSISHRVFLHYYSIVSKTMGAIIEKIKGMSFGSA